MDAKTQALWDAAFHAWITLGDVLAGHPVSPAELREIYAALHQAVDALKAERGPLE